MFADHGLYLGVESIWESFLDREFDGAGVIYEVEPESLKFTFDKIEYFLENGVLESQDCQECDLIYTDDNPEGYAGIFNNAATYGVDTNAAEVIAALKVLSTVENLDTVLDTDEIIRYFAVHNSVLKWDSYLGGTPHNLLLHNNKGRPSLVPWDYNGAFPLSMPFASSDAANDPTDLVNMGIDSPLFGTTEDERPMWKWIVDNDSYREQYHQAIDALITDTFESGAFDEEIGRVYELILPYVEKDPTGFYTADAFTLACETLRQLASRRAESIRKQLSGALPTVSTEQDDGDKVDASDL